MQTENERLSRGKQKMLQGPFLLCGWETGLEYVCVSVFGEGRGGGLGVECVSRSLSLPPQPRQLPAPPFSQIISCDDELEARWPAE